MRSVRLRRFAFAMVLGGVGCSSPGDGQSPEAAPHCALVAPSSCQMPVPSWSRDIQPIVNQTCAPCHFPGGQALKQVPYDYSTYAGIHRAPATTIENQLRSCLMPQDGGNAPLTTAEGDAILNWIVCGEPDN
jgi:hypothetical protein